MCLYCHASFFFYFSLYLLRSLKVTLRWITIYWPLFFFRVNILKVKKKRQQNHGKGLIASKSDRWRHRYAIILFVRFISSFFHQFWERKMLKSRFLERVCHGDLNCKWNHEKNKFTLRKFIEFMIMLDIWIFFKI